MTPGINGTSSAQSESNMSKNEAHLWSLGTTPRSERERESVAHTRKKKKDIRTKILHVSKEGGRTSKAFKELDGMIPRQKSQRLLGQPWRRQLRNGGERMEMG